jgi:hypothetical protein
VVSRRAAEQKVWQASQYEFEDVIGAVDDAALLAPLGRRQGPGSRLLHGAVNRAGAPVGRARRAAMEKPHAVGDCELLFAVFAAPHEIGVLPVVAEQLARATTKIAFIVELWVPQLRGVRDYLRQLRGFDHIFMFNRDAMPAVREITGVPTSYLATAVDALLFAPEHPGPTRSIDVTSYGRRLQGTHDALLRAMVDGRLTYDYDTVRGAFDVTGHWEHRLALATTLQRSRYAVVYRNNDEPGRLARTGGEESLTNRYFEALAAGAVMLGSAAECDDFERCFDWADAVVPIAAPEPDVVDVIEALDRQPERLARARSSGIARSLRRHDWAHRWQEVLDAARLRGLPGLDDRLRRLDTRADGWDEWSDGASADLAR